jgi:hypothetical protein
LVEERRRVRDQSESAVEESDLVTGGGSSTAAGVAAPSDEDTSEQQDLSSSERVSKRLRFASPPAPLSVGSPEASTFESSSVAEPTVSNEGRMSSAD